MITAAKIFIVSNISYLLIGIDGKYTMACVPFTGLKEINFFFVAITEWIA